MANQYSITPGVTLDGANGSASSINDSRRIFNFGERVAELAPQTSPFLTYLSRVVATDDPVFKFLEKDISIRNNFQVAVAKDILEWNELGRNRSKLDAPYDQFGREVSTNKT